MNDIVSLTQDQIDEICERRNKGVNRSLATLQEQHDALAEQHQSEIAAIETLQTEQASLEAKLAEPFDARAEVEARMEATRQQGEHYRAAYEANKREVALARAVAASGATSLEVVGAMLADVPTADLSAAVEALKETAPNLFAPTLARGVGGKTEPARGSDPIAAGARGVAMLSDAQFMEARASGKLDQMFGRK
jgi:chromosome segregation ATPase